MKISITVDPAWILSGDGGHTDFTARLVREAERIWNIGGASSTMLDCGFEYRGNAGPEQFGKELKELIEMTSDASFDASVFRVTIEEGGKEYTLGADGSVAAPSAEDDLFAQINALRGNITADPPKEHRENTEAVKPADGEKTSAAPPAAPPAATAEPVTETRKSAEEKPEAEKAAEAQPAAEPAKEDPPKPKRKASEDIMNLVGSGDFKRLAEDIRNTAPKILRDNTQKIFFQEIYLFSVDTGSGWHTSLNLLDGLLKETGLFTGDAKPDTLQIPPFHDPDVANRMKNAVTTLEVALEKQRLLSVDITEWIGHTHTKEFKKFAMQLFRMNERCAVVFRIPYVGKAVIEAAVRDIQDVVSVRPVVFEPFSGEELREIARRYLDETQFSFTNEAWELFDSRIEAEKADGYFYGVHTVQKLVGSMIRRQELLAPAEDGGKVIGQAAAAAPGGPAEKGEELSLDTLRKMVGMEAIAEKVTEIVNQIVFSRQTGVNSKPTMHMCFIGNPGTGKTTVARIIGRVLKERGVLRIGNFHEHHAQDLCAEYVGQTAPKTHAICQEAYGSVLFIDEAYSLASGGEHHNYGYGREAVDTLITEMENHSDDLIVVFAGYPDEIAKMIAMNPGMKSRIPYTIEFPNYTREQLAEIFMGMVRASFTCADGLEDRVKEFFGRIPDEEMADKTFGNGRYVRNIFERTWGKAVARSSGDGGDSIVVTAEDFDAATKDIGAADQKTEKRKIGF